jgi:hypothetical protein
MRIRPVPWIPAAFGILAVGTIVSYAVWRSVKPTDFMPSSNYAVYAGLFVMALALERVLEPFSGLFIPSVKAKKAQSTAMAAHATHTEVVAATSQLHVAVADPAAASAAQRAEEALQAAAAAQKDAAVAQKEHHHSQANRAVLMWATAAVLAMLACASLGIFLLRSIETPSAVKGKRRAAVCALIERCSVSPEPGEEPESSAGSAGDGPGRRSWDQTAPRLDQPDTDHVGHIRGQRFRHNEWLTAGHTGSPVTYSPAASCSSRTSIASEMALSGAAPRWMEQLRRYPRADRGK